MVSYDYIPFEGDSETTGTNSNETSPNNSFPIENNSSLESKATGTKRKCEIASPEPGTRENKRLRLRAHETNHPSLSGPKAKRPSLVGRPVQDSNTHDSSSPLSEVPSENVPTELGFNIIQIQREAYEKGFGQDHRAYALSELKAAVQRCERINANGLLDDDTYQYLLDKVRKTIRTKQMQPRVLISQPISSRVGAVGPEAPPKAKTNLAEAPIRYAIMKLSLAYSR